MHVIFYKSMSCFLSFQVFVRSFYTLKHPRSFFNLHRQFETRVHTHNSDWQEIWGFCFHCAIWSLLIWFMPSVVISCGFTLKFSSLGFTMGLKLGLLSELYFLCAKCCRLSIYVLFTLLHGLVHKHFPALVLFFKFFPPCFNTILCTAVQNLVLKIFSLCMTFLFTS